MKLPGYENIAQERYIPEQNVGAEARAMGEFSRVAQGIITQTYEQEAATEYTKAVADYKNIEKDLLQRYDQSPYMPADELGDLATKENTQAMPMEVTDPVTGEVTEQTVPVVRTDKIMAEHYRRSMGEVSKAMSTSLRTAKGRNSWNEKFNYELGPQGLNAVEDSAFKRTQAMNLADSIESLEGLKDIGDYKLIEEHISTMAATGLIPLEKEAEFTRETFSDVAYNKTVEEIADADLAVEDREALIPEIQANPYFTDKQRVRLEATARSAVYADHSDLVADAIIDNDRRRISELRSEYSQENYEGILKDGQRLTLIKRLNTAVDDINAGNAMADKIALHSARIEAGRVMKAVANGTSRPEELVALASLPMFDFGGANEKPTQKDVQLKEELAWTLDLGDELVGFPRMTVSDRDIFITKYAGDGAENEFKRQYLQKYADNIYERMGDNTSDYMIASGLAETMPGYTQPATPSSNPDYMEVVNLRTMVNAEKAANEGIGTGPLTSNEIIEYQRLWGGADTSGRLELLKEWTSLPGGVSQALMQQLGPNGLGDASYVAGMISLDPTIDGTSHASRSEDIASTIVEGVGLLADDEQRIKYIGTEKERGILMTGLTTQAMSYFPTRAAARAAAEAHVAYKVGLAKRTGREVVTSRMTETDLERIYGPLADTHWGLGQNKVFTPGIAINSRQFTKWLRNPEIDGYIDRSMYDQLGVDPEFANAKTDGRIYSGTEIREGVKDGSFKLLPTQTRGVYFVQDVNDNGVVGLNNNKYRLAWDASYGN